MKRVVLLLYFLIWLNAVSTVAAQGFYPDFALVVQRPSYETFMTNLGNSPIRIDYYEITSPSGSLSPSGWKKLSSAGPEIVAALGPGADQFFALSANANVLGEGEFSEFSDMAAWSILEYRVSIQFGRSRFCTRRCLSHLFAGRLVAD